MRSRLIKKFVPVLKRPAGAGRLFSDVAARNAAHWSRPTILGAFDSSLYCSQQLRD